MNSLQLRQELEKIRRMLDALDQSSRSERLDTVGVFHSLERAFTETLRNLYPSVDWHFRSSPDDLRSLNQQLFRIEQKIDNLALVDRTCSLREEYSYLPKLLTATSDNSAKSNDTEQVFHKASSEWFTQARAVVVDPWIFSNGTEDVDSYCERVTKMFSDDVKLIEFYFGADSNKPEVAAKIFDALKKQNGRTFGFYKCSNIHDRVWLRHFELIGTPSRKNWEGRVIGASVNGIKLRPTYIIDMGGNDAADYSTYLQNVRKAATFSTTPNV